jgi:antirestriction protein
MLRTPMLLSTIKQIDRTDKYAFKLWLERQHGIKQPICHAKINIGNESLDYLVDQFYEQYQGEYYSLGEWAEDYIDATDLLDGANETILEFFDYKAFGEHARDNGDIWTVFTIKDNSLYVFLTK